MVQIEIDKIVVEGRIRKDFGNIEEFAQDIKENGLIHPPVVTPDFRLIAGERRLRACQHLGWHQIEVRVMTVRDRKHEKTLEVNENGSRKDFTFSEMMDAAREIERLERIEAEERKKAGKTIDHMQNFASGTTREKVAEQIGLGSGEQYRKAKYISDNATPETIRKLDEGEMTIHRAYEQTKRELAEKEAELAEAKDNEQALLDTIESLRSQPEPDPVIIEKPVYQVREIVPADVQARLTSAEEQIAKIEKERDELEVSLVRSYDRIRELEKLERSVKSTEHNPLFDIYRSASNTVSYLQTFTENERFACDIIAGAERKLVDSLRHEMAKIEKLSREMWHLIDSETRVVVVDGGLSNTNQIVEVIA